MIFKYIRFKLIPLILLFIAMVIYKPYTFSEALTAKSNAAPFEMSREQAEKLGDMLNEFYNGLSEKEKKEFEEQVKQEAIKIERMNDFQREEYFEDSIKKAMDVLDEIEIGPKNDPKIIADAKENTQENLSEEDKPEAEVKREVDTKDQDEESNRKRNVQAINDKIGESKMRIGALQETFDAIYPWGQHLIMKMIDDGKLDERSKHFRSDLDILMLRLDKLDDKDSATNIHKYISQPKDIEALRGQLEILLNTLRKNVAKVDQLVKCYSSNMNIEHNIKGVHTKKENTSSKKVAKRAFENIVNDIESIKDLILTEADKIFDKFDKTIAQKIKKEEAKIKKQAEEDYKKLKLQRTPRSNGSELFYSRKPLQAMNDYDDDNNATYPYMGPWSPDVYAQRAQDFNRKVDPESTTESDKEKPSKTKEEKGEVEKTKLTPAEKATYMTNERLNAWLGTIYRQKVDFEEVAEQKEEIWKELKKYFQADQIDEGFKIRVREMLELTENIRSKTNLAIGEIKKLDKLGKKEAKQVYIEKLNDIKNRAEILKVIHDKINKLKEADVQSLPKNVQDAFFAREKEFNLLTLKKNISDIWEKMGMFEKQ